MFEKCDDFEVIEIWMKDEVNWLDELCDFFECIFLGELVMIWWFNGILCGGLGSIGFVV